MKTKTKNRCCMCRKPIRKGGLCVGILGDGTRVPACNDCGGRAMDHTLAYPTAQKMDRTLSPLYLERIQSMVRVMCLAFGSSHFADLTIEKGFPLDESCGVEFTRVVDMVRFRLIYSGRLWKCAPIKKEASK